MPAGARYYLTIDIDGFDPSIASGTGTPSHGGFLYYEVLELIAGLARRGTIVGIDLVEVAPDYDHTGATAILAAWVISFFEATIAKMAVLAALQSIVAGQGGNAGTQTLTIMVRGLALGELDPRNTWPALLKELGL